MFICLWDCFTGWIRSYIYAGILVETTLQNRQRCLIHFFCWGHSNTNSWYNFSRDVHFIAAVIAEGGLYWTVSSLLEKATLVQMWSYKRLVNSKQWCSR